MSVSSTENLRNFEDRIRRIEGAGRKAGRVRRNSSGEYFRKEEERKKRRRKGKKANWTGRILLIVAAFLGVKTYIIFNMGADAYEARMAELRAGERYEQLAAMVLQPDPATDKLQEFLANSGVIEPKPAATTDTPQVLTAGVAGPEASSVATDDTGEGAASGTGPESEEADTTSAASASQ
jgi:hypothetical protein